MQVTQVQRMLQRWREDRLQFLTDVLTHPDGRSYGANLDPWQVEDFNAVFGTKKHVWLERPRGHSKTMDAAAAALTELLFGAPGGRLYFTAVDADQAAIAFDSVQGFVRRSPFLSSVLRVLKREVVMDATDSKLEVLPADAAGSWGLRPSFILVDELHAWRTERAVEFFHALYSSLGKVQGARMLVTTTAGWDKTSLCWQLREQVMTDPAWTFSRRGQVASWVSPDFLEQQKRLLPAHVFQMLHLNEWTDAGGAFLTHDEVASIFSDDIRQTFRCESGRHFIGLDVGLSNDATAAVVLHLDRDGRAVVDWIQTWRGQPGARVDLDEVGRWLLDAAMRYARAEIVADPWQSVHLVQTLQKHGVKAREVHFSQSYRQRIFSNLLEAVRAERLKCYHHQELKDELLGLEFREVNGNLRVDHRPGRHDDRAVALAVALLAATEEGAKPDQDPYAIDILRRAVVHGFAATPRRRRRGRPTLEEFEARLSGDPY